MHKLGGLSRGWVGAVCALLAWAGVAAAAKVTFTYTPPKGLSVHAVDLRGSMNSWGESAMARHGGSWSVTIALKPGVYQYKYYIDGHWPKNMCKGSRYGSPVSPQAQACIGDGYGGANAVITVKASSAPSEAQRLGFHFSPQQADDLSVAQGQLTLRFQVGDGRVQAAKVWVGRVAYPAFLQLRTSKETWMALVPAGTESFRFQLELRGGGTRSFGPYRSPAHPFTAVNWVGKGTAYEIFPNSFYNGNPANDLLWKTDRTDEYYHNPKWQENPSRPRPLETAWLDAPVTAELCCHQYLGGDLRGVLDQLPYLKFLGVHLIYLTPIFEAGSTHGYDTSNYLKLAPWLGKTSTLKALLHRAHQLGMHVIFDFVPEDTGLGSPMFQSVVKLGPRSPYWSWYTINKWPFTPGDASAYQSWEGVASLPLLKTTNPQVERYLLHVAEHWIRFGFDGVRVDSPSTMVNDHSFIRKLRQAVLGINPRAYLLGEDWNVAPQWLQGHQFDSVMNYAIGRNVLIPYAGGRYPFLGGKWALQQLSFIYSRYPVAAQAMGFNVLSTHDTSRLLSQLSNLGLGGHPSPLDLARQRLAIALDTALPGTPVTFQGDECAFLGKKSPDDQERYPFQWSQCSQAMLLFYHRLGLLKTSVRALHSPVWRAGAASGGVLSFYRGAPGKGELLAIFNDQAATKVSLPQGNWTDLWNGEVVRGSLALPRMGWAYLSLR